MNLSKIFRLILLGQIFLLAILGWYFRDALNPDAVAYLRIGSYYAEGNFNLAISGYWGPLLSWLLAIGYKCGLPPLMSARMAMALSAIVFLWGSKQLYEVLRLSERWRLGGLLLAAAASAWWSVQFITPDLLLSGVLLVAVARMISGAWLEAPSHTAITGVWWGVAYLIKAIALPLGVLVILVFGWRAVRKGEVLFPRIVRSIVLVFAVFGVLAAPWITVLTVKYERLTFSTTPPITHTLTGPPDAERYHPFARHFHTPAAGRITSWEEPSRMAYQTWSPWENRDYARHQIAVLARNSVTVLFLWTSIHLAAVGLLVRWLIVWRNCRARMAMSDLLVLPLCLAAIYLPCYFTFAEQRFFYVTLPFFFAGTVRWLDDETITPTTRRLISLAICLAAVFPLFAQVVFLQDRTAIAGNYAAQLAIRMREAEVLGPIAGSANLPGGRTGLYVAFHLNQPWHGDELSPTPESILASGAKFFLVRRASPLAETLLVRSEFENLDERLFRRSEMAFPVQVFAIKPVEN